MPWPGCLRTGSRKSPARTLIAALLFLPATTAGAQLHHQAAVVPTESHLDISITATGADIDSLFDTLREGMRARIEYRIRVTAPRARPFRWLGDRLVEELRPTFDVRWDPYLSRYEVEDGSGELRAYEDEAALYAEFFSLSHYRVPWEAVAGESLVIVETSARYTPIVFVPGLSILSIFTQNRSANSPWARHVVDRVEGAGP